MEAIAFVGGGEPRHGAVWGKRQIGKALKWKRKVNFAKSVGYKAVKKKTRLEKSAVAGSQKSESFSHFYFILKDVSYH